MNKLTTFFVGLMVATSCAAEGWQVSVAKFGTRIQKLFLF